MTSVHAPSQRPAGDGDKGEPGGIISASRNRRLRRRLQSDGDDDGTSSAGQFLSCFVKHVNEKRRDVVATLLEFGLPILFVVGSIILWSVFENKDIAGEKFLDYYGHGTANPMQAPAARKTTSFDVVRSAVCVNTTETPSGIAGIANCNLPANAINTTCFPPHPLLPAAASGICTTDVQGLKVFVRGITYGLTKSLIYPFELDDIILFHWLVKILRMDKGFTNFNTAEAAIKNSGRLLFAPNNAAVTNLVGHFNATSNLFPHIFGGMYATAEEAAAEVMRVDREGMNWGMIHVGSLTPSNFDVEIRLNHSSLPRTAEIINKFYLGGVEPDSMLYVLSGFYTLESAISKYYLETIVSPGLTVEAPMTIPMGFATYDPQPFLAFGGTIIPLLIVLGFLYPVSQLSKRIVLEKELRIREAMFIMGLTNTPFYAAWVAVYTIQHLLTAVVITIILKATYVSRADWGVLFFSFFFFELSTISLAGLLSSIFSKARLAALVTPLVYFAISIPLFMIQDASASTRRSLLILSPTAFSNAIQLLFQHEMGGGLGSGQLADKEDDPSMIVVIIMLAFDTIIYFLLWLWADAIAPNDWGTPRWCCYCLTDPFVYLWKLITGRDTVVVDVNELPDGRSPQGVYEDAIVDDKTTVQLVGLRKSFARGSKTFVAVNNLYWQLREGEISVLLGHNGAGKTTTMNLMTGMLEADGGDAYIYGYSVRNELNMVRREIGLCPQHNILWPDLTCEEHLRFYGSIKGVTGKALDDAVTNMLESVDLVDKRSYKSSALSGGQKRKLSVAIAFVGGSRLIFLDEPTAGMDVGARRHTWSLLQRMASSHTILLSTHFMDEADLLGHSIGIMANGSLQCSGSSLFLKSRLGVGYNIVLGVEAHADAKRLQREIQTFVSDATLLSAGPGEVTFRLPAHSVANFAPMLAMLENNGATIGVRNFSISATTLEEIFLQLAHGAEELERARGEQAAAVVGADSSQASNGSVVTPSVVQVNGNFIAADGNAQPMEMKQVPTEVSVAPISHEQRKKAGGASVWNVERLEAGSTALMLMQTKAMLSKRLSNSLRDRRTQCLQVILPVCCLLLAMLFTLISFFSAPSIVLSYDLYEEPTIVDFQGCATLFNLSLPISSVVARSPAGLQNAMNLSNYLYDTANLHGDYPRYGAVACEDATLGTLLGGIPPQSVVFYNTSVFHELPIGVYNYFNSIYRRIQGASSTPMRLVNNPMPKTPREEALESSIRSMLIGIIIMIPFTFIPSTFVSWIVKERECKARHLQNVSGLGFGVYWISNFLFDIVSFLVTMALALIVFAIFNRTEYIGAEAIGACILLFFFYGLAGVAFSYLVSFFFDEHSTAQNIVMLVNFIAGFLLVLCVFILSIVESTKDASKVLAYIFRLVPSYALGDGIINLSLLQAEKAFGTTKTAWSMTVCGADILYMALEFPVALLLVFFIDHPKRRMKTQALLHNPDAPVEVIEDEDDDVARERKEVEDPVTYHRDKDLVLVTNLRKEYGNGKVAVKNLSFGVHPGEVFGFLGTNGAGKTTTISILCQEFFPSSGHGFIAGYDIVNNAEEALRCIGYCPQFDALLDLLTVEEHLRMYAGVRGIVPSERDRIVAELAELCELTQYLPTISSELSGGNKRKLSVALSLLGGPRVVFLDEPSAGMDPMARRGLWTAIETVADNCSVVLTTHHLEEVEALAHRVGIMVDGTLRCIGDKLHLKTKYGSGFELSLKVANISQCPGVEAFVKEHIPQAELNEARGLRYTYALPQDTRLSAMFGLLEGSKVSLGVTDYSVSQTSIEQVFLRISEEAEERNALEEQRKHDEGNGKSRPTGAAAAEAESTAIVQLNSASRRRLSSGGPGI